MSPLRYLPLLLLLAMAPAAGSDLVVVVNSHVAVQKLNQDDVINIYMGRYRRLPTGIAAYPIDQPEESELKAEFYRKLVNKSLTDISAYWARLVFSGKTAPPRQAAGHTEAIKLLNSVPGAMVYLERNQVDSRFRVVFDFAERP
jgi:hypothetical protein